MAIIVKNNTFSAGATIVASEHNANFDTIYADYNGNITNANIAAGAAIGMSKIDKSTDVTWTGTHTYTQNDTDACNILTNTGDGPHARFTGDPTVAAPTDGDFWFTGSALNFRNGSTTIDLLSGGSATASFLVQADGSQTDIATGSAITIQFATEQYDTGDDFASNTFTAPSTGRYLLSYSLDMKNVDTATSYDVQIVVGGTSALTLTQTYAGATIAADGETCWTGTAVMEMTATDTANIKVTQAAGTQQTDVDGNSWFSGSLI